MNVDELIEEVRRFGATLAVVDGRLRASPPGAIPSELRAVIREHLAEIKARLIADGGMGADSPRLQHERNRWSEENRPRMPLRRCGTLVCRTCHSVGPSPHRADCGSPRFDTCGSRWFWLSAHGAIKCVACATPTDFGLVEAWVLARETGDGDDGWEIPREVLPLLHVAEPKQ